MKCFRTLVMVLAVVVSGLALVATVPAPPAAAQAAAAPDSAEDAELRRTLVQGSLEITPGASPVCQVIRWSVLGGVDGVLHQEDNAWYRRFDLGDLNLRGSFAPQVVTFGVGELRKRYERNFVPVRVRVYALSNDSPLTLAELQKAPYAEDTVELTEMPEDQMAGASVRNLSFKGLDLDPATQDAVVEVYHAGGPDTEGEIFKIGANYEGESAPAFAAVWVYRSQSTGPRATP